MKNVKPYIKSFIKDKKYKFARQKLAVIAAAILMGCVTSIPIVMAIKETTQVEASTYGTVTADYLNVRSGAGTNYDIKTYNGELVRLANGTKVTIISTTGKWYKITFTYKNKSMGGYVCSDYVKKTENTSASTTASATSSKTTGVVNTDYLNVRKGAGTSYDKLTISGKNVQLAKGTSVTILSTKSGWYYVSFKYGSTTAKGYVYAKYVDKKTSATASSTTTKTVKQKKAITINGKVNCNSLNVRTGAGVSAARLKLNNQNVMLDNNQAVRIIGEQNIDGVKWYKISFTYKSKKLTGFVHGNYISITVPTSGLAAKTISTGSVYIKNNTSGNIMAINGKNVSLKKNTVVSVKSQKIVNSQNWYIVSFTYNGTTKKGYLKASEVTLDLYKYVTVTVSSTTKAATTKAATTKAATTKAATTKAATTKPAATATTKPTATATATAKPTATATATAVTDAQFKKNLQSEGFPSDYITKLMQLHKAHPNWVFKAYDTGLDWSSAVSRESAAGINLIPSTKNISWLSLGTSAYVWKEDRFVVYDNPNWVTSSQAVNAYYMDPRNFLDDTYIFMFENLSYDSNNQTRAGVEAILKNTAMGKSYVTYIDSSTGNTVKKLYSQIFMEAAKYSGVSPYHLASRSKQEIVTGTTTLSSSVSGTVAGYEGLYNYYNIGATNSTLKLGAIKNGLTYAKNGSSSATKNELYLIPWTTPYKAIVGGAYFIGSSYIKQGQNTLYLQKFNVTSTKTYSHQYMGNVQAAWAEAAKTAAAYKSMEDYDDMVIVFNIPVFDNMPSKVSALPADGKNPNNWLKTLTVTNSSSDQYTLTPTFDISKDQEYTMSVSSGVSIAYVNATAVSSKATVSGTGKISLSTGVNEVKVTVTAENGDKRTYIINVIKKS